MEQTIEHLHELAEVGFTVAHGTVARVGTLRSLELMAERVIPALPHQRESAVQEFTERLTVALCA